VRHRVACVHGEVQEHLLELAAVALDVRRPGVRPSLELDLGAEQAFQHPDHA
jgi:hypothetical protein